MTMTKTKNQKEGKKLRLRIRNNPDWYFNDVLGFFPWSKQIEIIRSIQKHRRTTVRSCNGGGKTFSIARIAHWFLASYKNSLVINTAPTWRQIENQYWRHFRDAHSKAKYDLGGQMLKTQFNFREDWFAIGIAADTKNVASFQGWHAKNILVIFDEASGIPHEIWEAVEGLLSGGINVRFVAIGNPNLASGDFNDTFTSPLYNKIHISAFDLPNVIEKRHVIPGLSTWEWVEEMRKKYGEDSDIWRVRVLGDPPKSEKDTLISLGLVESAIDSDRERYGIEVKKLGVDVARYGDDRTALVLRIGNWAKVIDVIEKFDTMEVAGVVAKYLRENTDVDAYIDITGGLGAGVFDRLREQSDIAGRVFGVNVAGAPKDKESYINIRMESWDAMRLWLRDAVLEKHEDFYQLAMPKYKINSNGRMQLESKEDMKKRKIHSPDVGDALALTLSRATEGENLGLVWI